MSRNLLGPNPEVPLLQLGPLLGELRDAFRELLAFLHGQEEIGSVTELILELPHLLSGPKLLLLGGMEANAAVLELLIEAQDLTL